MQSDRTLYEAVADHGAATPDKVAVVSHHASGGRPEVLSYRQLLRLVDRFAGALLSLGVGSGDVVSFQLPNWWQVPALHLACVRIGAIANPITPILRREVKFILDRVEARLCIVPGIFRGFDHAAMVSAMRGELPTLDRIFVIGGSDAPGTESFEAYFCDTRWEDRYPAEKLDALRPEPHSPAEIMFSSGTTGEPKGVVHSHVTMDAGLRAVSEPLGLGNDDVVLMFSPLGHQTGYLYGMCMPLRYGMKVVFQDSWDPEVMLHLIADEGVTWTMGSTTFVVDACAAARAHPDVDLSSLKYFTCGGAPIPPQAVVDAQTHLGTRLVAVWGMTEVGVCTITRPDDTVERVASSDGRPCDWVDVRIASPEGESLPAGTEGRLLVKTASQHLAYHLRHDLYAASFDAEGWFDTGDLARVDEDGYIRITGRAKDLIIRGGENIPVAEVEAALYTHPEIREVAVVAVPDARLGERACAVVVPAASASWELTLEALQTHLEAYGLPKPFWPELVVVREALPKTESGKVQKYVLRSELGGHA